MIRYLVFCDKRFRPSAVKELSAHYPDSKIEEAHLSGNFLIVSSKTTMKQSEMSFIDSIIPVSAELEKAKYTDEAVTSSIRKIVTGRDKFRIEALNLGSHSGANAKTIEVFLGQRLEKEGLAADLKAPDLFVYVILTSDRIFICKADRGDTLDAFRANKFKENEKVSRSEFKLKEAMEYFGIDPREAGWALDLGAAPGGWTRYMMNHGAHVVAVDKGALDKSLHGEKLVHIQKLAQDIVLDTLPKHDFGMLLIDMNINPSDSAKLAVKYADALRKDGHLILTVKLVDSKIAKHIKDVGDILSPKFSGIRVKKLPHNRMELTLSATKR